MPLGKGGPHNQEGEKGHPSKKTLFYRYWLI